MERAKRMTITLSSLLDIGALMIINCLGRGATFDAPRASPLRARPLDWPAEIGAQTDTA